MKKKKSLTKKPKDFVLIHGVTEDGRGLAVLRCKDERIEAGSVRPLEEGKAITGEVVRLTPRADFPLLCEVETTLESKSSPDNDVASTKVDGPAQVATPKYRANWTQIWGKTPKGANAPN